MPLLPRHVHSLTAAGGPVPLNSSTYDAFLSSNGNVAPELFKCICPLKVRGKLVGVIALGRRPGDALYEEDALDAFQMLSHYVALAIQNHTLSQTLTQRVSENVRLLASLHGFYDNALEAFAIAIDVKHVNIQGHSLRVGRYAQAIGEAIGMDAADVASLRSAAYLHDIGMVAIDKRLFGKPSQLDADESARCRTTRSLGIRSSARCSSPGGKFRRSFVGTTNALTGRDTPTACMVTKSRKRCVSWLWPKPSMP